MADAVKYGLSRTGFKRKRLTDIIASLNARVANKLGVPIQTGANSIFGQLHGVYGYEIADLWEATEDVYNAMYPSTAPGTSLSNAAGLAGVAQISAEKTTAYVTCYGEDGFVIPKTTKLALSSDQSVTFTATSAGQSISVSTANVYQLGLESVTAGETVGVSIDSVSFTHTITSGESVSDVLGAIASSLQTARTDLTTTVSNGILDIRTTDPTKTFSVLITGGYQKLLGSPVQFACDEYGAISPAIGDLSVIISTYSQLTAVSNEADATVGRDAETDIELRQRWHSGLYDRASAMVEAIQAGVMTKVAGVTKCAVYENVEDTIDTDGRKPHSIEVIVTGGEPVAIAKEIFRTKAAGIDTNGTNSQVMYDSQGIPHTILFNRATVVKVWLRVIVWENPEEAWSPSALIDIRSALYKKLSTLSVGEDVVLQKYYSTVFNATTGVGRIDIQAAMGDAPTDVSYSASNIVISPRQASEFALTQISVTKGA